MSDARMLIEKFGGVDFRYWRMHIQYYLTSRDLEAAFEEKPEEMADEDYKKVDRHKV